MPSNRRNLEFGCRTMLEVQEFEMGTKWPARVYDVETIKSLPTTEYSDKFLLSCSGLLKALAIIARGKPFASKLLNLKGRHKIQTTHECIAILNRSLQHVSGLHLSSTNVETRIKACSALSDLAIEYEKSCAYPFRPVSR